MFKVNIKDTRTTGVFIVNFEHISQQFLVFLLLILSMYCNGNRISQKHKCLICQADSTDWNYAVIEIYGFLTFYECC